MYINDVRGTILLDLAWIIDYAKLIMLMKSKIGSYLQLPKRW